jgi:ABC-type multidrug transport system ATPase subunit
VLQFADRVVALPGDGTGLLAGPTREVLPRLPLVPPLIALARALNWEPLPLTTKEGMRFSPLAHVCVPPLGGKTRDYRRTLANANGEPLSTPPHRSSGEPFLRAHNVTVGYSGQSVLRGVNLAVWPGEIVVLMGRNGSGKTTLLKSLVGLTRLQAGRVKVAGRDVAGQDVAAICRRVGYLPQDPNTLLFADTALEELLITLRNHGLSDDAGDPLAKTGGYRRSQALLKRLGIAGLADRYPRDLSVGERQRVALGSVTVTQPGALLLDEPTRGLDYTAKKALTDLLRGWRDSGMAILLVTHDVEFAAAVADRVVLMAQGEIIADGEPAEVMGSSPLFAPQIARLFPGCGWLTVADCLAHLVSTGG